VVNGKHGNYGKSPDEVVDVHAYTSRITPTVTLAFTDVFHPSNGFRCD
jgi:hypothetical protein